MNLTFVESHVGLRNLCLGALRMDESHTGSNVAEWARKMLEQVQLKIGDPFTCPIFIAAATTDNATNMKSAVAKLELLHIPCACHVLNLAVKDVFADERWTLIPQIRQFVAFMGRCVNLSDCLEKIIPNHETDIRQKISQLYPSQAESKGIPTKLIDMVSTRWMSIYHCIQRLIVLWSPLESLCMTSIFEAAWIHRRLLLLKSVSFHRTDYTLKVNTHYQSISFQMLL